MICLAIIIRYQMFNARDFLSVNLFCKHVKTIQLHALMTEKKTNKSLFKVGRYIVTPCVTSV